MNLDSPIPVFVRSLGVEDVSRPPEALARHATRFHAAGHQRLRHRLSTIEGEAHGSAAAAEQRVAARVGAVRVAVALEAALRVDVALEPDPDARVSAEYLRRKAHERIAATPQLKHAATPQLKHAATLQLNMRRRRS